MARQVREDERGKEAGEKVGCQSEVTTNDSDREKSSCGQSSAFDRKHKVVADDGRITPKRADESLFVETDHQETGYGRNQVMNVDGGRLFGKGGDHIGYQNDDYGE